MGVWLSAGDRLMVLAAVLPIVYFKWKKWL